jgi:hypothetical protein
MIRFKRTAGLMPIGKIGLAVAILPLKDAAIPGKKYFRSSHNIQNAAR